MSSFHKKYRPGAFVKVVGQESAVTTLQNMIERKTLPQAILFTGPSGTGKTTLARILKKKLGCHDSDFQEINAANFRGIDTVRDITQRMNLAPTFGDVRMFLIDEAHMMTNDAQTALLIPLEDTPKHVYFILCTTHPQKLIKTILTRCSTIALKPVTDADLTTLVKQIAAAEKLTLKEETVDKIVECAQGSARQAVVFLDKIANLDTVDKQLSAISEASSSPEAIELCRLLAQPSPSWKEVGNLLQKLQDDPEGVRWLVLSYFTKMLYNGNTVISNRARSILENFQFNYFDTKKAGLVLSCFNSVFSGKR